MKAYILTILVLAASNLGHAQQSLKETIFFLFNSPQDSRMENPGDFYDPLTEKKLIQFQFNLVDSATGGTMSFYSLQEERIDTIGYKVLRKKGTFSNIALQNYLKIDGPLERGHENIFIAEPHGKRLFVLHHVYRGVPVRIINCKE